MKPHFAADASRVSPTRSWLARLLRDWKARARGRCELRRMDARQLRDIGLDDEQLGRETAEPFWRA